MNLIEKTELIEKLTREVILEAQSEEFKNKSEDNKRIAGLFRVFGAQFSSSVTSMKKFASNSEC